MNVGISVSRVGGAAQIKAMKKVAGTLRLELAQYRELAAFAQFGSDLDKATQEQLASGERLIELLKQGQYEPLPIEEQVVSIYAATPKPPRPSWVRRYALLDIGRYEEEMLSLRAQPGREVLRAIRESGQLTEDTETKLAALLDQFANQFQPSVKTEAA